MKKMVIGTTLALSLMIPTIASASSYFTAGVRQTSPNTAYAYASYDYHTVYAKVMWGSASSVWAGGWGNATTSSITYNGGGNPTYSAYYQ